MVDHTIDGLNADSIVGDGARAASCENAASVREVHTARRLHMRLCSSECSAVAFLPHLLVGYATVRRLAPPPKLKSSSPCAELLRLSESSRPPRSLRTSRGRRWCALKPDKGTCVESWQGRWSENAPELSVGLVVTVGLTNVGRTCTALDCEFPSL